MHYHYFPEEVLALQAELQYHPDLLTILAVQADPDPYVHIAEISAYCGVVLDGTYTQADILGICKVCTQRLQAKRVIIVLPPSA